MKHTFKITTDAVGAAVRLVDTHGIQHPVILDLATLCRDRRTLTVSTRPIRGSFCVKYIRSGVAFCIYAKGTTTYYVCRADFVEYFPSIPTRLYVKVN